MNARRPTQDVRCVLGGRNGAPMAQHDNILLDPHRSISALLYARDTVVQRDVRLRSDAPARRQPHVDDEHVRPSTRHRLRVSDGEHVRGGEEAELVGLMDHVDLERVRHARLLKVLAERAVDEADSGEILHAAEADVLELSQEARHDAERVRATHARHYARVLDDRDDFVRLCASAA